MGYAADRRPAGDIQAEDNQAGDVSATGERSPVGRPQQSLKATTLANHTAACSSWPYLCVSMWC